MSIAVGLVVAVLLGLLGDHLYHRFWPFESLKDEINRVGPPLPGASIVRETTSDGCWLACPDVTATWHLARPVLLADAQFLVAERIRGKGYRQEESGPCWEAPPPPDPHAVVTCTLDFGRTGGGYGVTFVVSPRYASVITSSASYKLHNLQEMPVTVDAAPVISMTSSVG